MSMKEGEREIAPATYGKAKTHMNGIDPNRDSSKAQELMSWLRYGDP